MDHIEFKGRLELIMSEFDLVPDVQIDSESVGYFLLRQLQQEEGTERARSLAILRAPGRWRLTLTRID